MNKADEEHNRGKNAVDVPLAHDFEVDLEYLPAHGRLQPLSLVLSLLVFVLVRVQWLIHICLILNYLYIYSLYYMGVPFY